MMRVNLSPDQVCGLVVGEGCFFSENAPDPGYRSGWRIRPAFSIEMRADEAPVLEGVREVLGCGSVYKLDFGRYKGYEQKGWHPHVKYRVTKIQDLYASVVPFFRKHELFGRKAIAFELFAEIVELLARREHLEPEGLIQARDLASRLSAHNQRGARER